MNSSKQTIYLEITQLLRTRQYEKAELLLKKHLTFEPEDAQAHSLLGHSLMRQKRLDESIEAFSLALSLKPNSADAHGDLGRASLRAKHSEKALRHFRQAVKLDPSFSEIWLLLGNYLMENGNHEEGRAALIQAEQTDPYRNTLAEVHKLLTNKRTDEAEKQCLSILNRVQIHAGAIVVMARLAIAKKAWVRAESMLKKGLQHAPYHMGLWHKLAEVSEALCKHQQQIDSLERCVLIAPKSSFLHAYLGKVYTNIGLYSPALRAFDTALAIDGDNPEYLLQRGYAYRFMGNRSACESDFRQCLSLKPNNGAAYWALADLKDYPFNDADVSDMSAIFEQKSVAQKHRSMAGFALAKCTESRGDYKQAFDIYQQANDLHPDAVFNPDSFDHHNKESRKLYSKSFLQNSARAPETEGPIPIFVVGLPRSGSTLIEQVLASHSAIEGTMELTNLPRVAVALEEDSYANGMSVDQYLQQLKPEALASYGQQYLDETAIFRSGADYFIDKRPGNFRLAGLIQLILPNARIIDVRRHPLAAGWGAYKQHFGSGFDFTYRLDNIARYYLAYLQMMDHWDEVMPGSVFHQSYEDMVNDADGSVRAMLSYLGLNFEQACLDFHKNERSVHTASSEQVRQPIFRTGLKSWMPYDEQLAPLKAAIGEEVLSRWA